ncbi:MAG: PilT/PilU family type 4a pilus ATPase [Chitinivibrionales bacterium]|nr:PilT/PilU family type 4a pilus ATPase [Chitinivibrionales bacterium]MBD3393983.1 PilT/PilU family type 4a pilus ATPase [Chitinivibrionales bacterium]
MEDTAAAQRKTKTDEFLKSLVTQGVSDVHFKVGRPPLARMNGILRPVNAPALSQKDTEYLASVLLGENHWERFKDLSESDTSYSIPGFSRFRVSVFRQRGSVSLVLRVIPFNVPTLDDLMVPSVAKQIALSPRGLILVTGATGTGKSSTLAGMINHINDHRESHVITIEDPIEFLHRDRKSSINQREIGVDTDNFNDAFRAALRQDPDVVLVGELRDLETMTIALRAAETGHLVLSTLHTTDAKESIGRFIDAFPPHQHRQIRIQLAANLRAVISQRLLKRADGAGLVLAAEVMVVNAAIREYMADEGKLSEILKNIEKGRDTYGMQTFDQALFDLLQQGYVTADEAVKHATSPNDFKLKLSFHQQSASGEGAHAGAAIS